MKHSVERSARLELDDGLRTGAGSHRLLLNRVAVWALACTVVLPLAGCVSASKHRALEAERDALAKQKADVGKLANHLEVSNASLESERVKLYDELEDLRVEREALAARRDALERDVMRLSESEGRLSEELEATSLALSAASLEVKDLQSTYQGLVADLEMELQKGEIEIEQLRSGLRLAVSDEILFASGSAKLDPEGAEMLEKVAANISKLDYAIDVEGHSDNIAIRGTLQKRYPTNWELAGARASSVVRLLERGGIDGKRLKAISRASHAPVASNDDEDGRSMNRRIEILLRPQEETDLIPVAVDADAANAGAGELPQVSTGGSNTETDAGSQVTTESDGS